MAHIRSLATAAHRLALAVGLLVAAACAPYRAYVAAPLAPEREANAYSSRRLDDPDLAAFWRETGISRVDSGLSPAALGVAALFFRPELPEAHALVTAARAAEITAGARPFPSASATLGHASPVTEGATSPWSISLTAGLTLETGGKRGARVVRARAATLAAGLRRDATAWWLAQDSRIAAVNALGAEQDLAAAEAEVDALRTVLALIRARFAEGRVSVADVAQAETDLQTAVVGVTQARRARTSARVQLGRALGAAFPAVDGVPLRSDPHSGCELADTLARGEAAFASMVLHERFEVGAALADYAVAEGDLRVAVAQQYPNLEIGPGIAWDQGVLRWILSLGSSAIPTNRNRGPIAEAEARRAVQAAHVAVVQDSVLAQLDLALAGCRDLRGEIAAAASLVASTTARLRVAEAAYARGEIGETEVALTRLALVRVSHTQRQTLQRRQLAGAALEAAIGRWITLPEVRWPAMREPATATNAPSGMRQEKKP